MKMHMSREAFRQIVGSLPPDDVDYIRMIDSNGNILHEYVFTSRPEINETPTAGDILQCAELERIYALPSESAI